MHVVGLYVREVPNIWNLWVILEMRGVADKNTSLSHTGYYTCQIWTLLVKYGTSTHKNCDPSVLPIKVVQGHRQYNIVRLGTPISDPH